MRTLGMFAKQPVPGRVKTRLAADWGVDRAAGLYQAFVRDLIQNLDFQCRDPADEVVRVLGFAPNEAPARTWFEEATAGRWSLWPQPETDLGGRIVAFFGQYASRQGSSAVLVGSDAPTLPVTFVLDAFHRLQSADVVLCPASDGGYCLIGLRAGFNSASLFEEIDWSTERVLAQTARRIQDLGLSLDLLPIWYDVDSVAGVEMLRGHLVAMDIAKPPETSALANTREFLSNETS